MPAATWSATIPRNASCQFSKLAGAAALEREHADQPIARRAAAAPAGSARRPGPAAGSRAQRVPPRRRCYARRAPRGRSAGRCPSGRRAACADRAPPCRSGPRRTPPPTPTPLSLVAAAGDGEQPPPGLVDQQHLRVRRSRSPRPGCRAPPPSSAPDPAPGSCALDSRCSTHSSSRWSGGTCRLAGRSGRRVAGSGGRRWPSTCSTSSTSKTSAREQPEDAGHAGVRRDRVDARRHPLESRPRRLRAHEAELQRVDVERDRVPDRHRARAGSRAGCASSC